MNEADIIRLVRQVIRQEIAPIMMARVVSNESKNRSTLKRFESDAPFGNIRNIQPYGISSRAPKSTQALVIPVAGDITHQNMVGHFDEGRPSVADGESILYGADGQVVFMKTGGSIHQGSKTANEPVVLGNILKTTLNNILKAFIDNQNLLGYDSLGLPLFLSPVIVQALQDEIDNHLDDVDQNILSKKNFVERGA